MCFWFVSKTIRGAASATLPQKHLPWFKALINSLEMDLQSDDNHIKHEIQQVRNRCVDPFNQHLNTPFTISLNYLPLKLMCTPPSQTQHILMFYLYNFILRLCSCNIVTRLLLWRSHITVLWLRSQVNFESLHFTQLCAKPLCTHRLVHPKRLSFAVCIMTVIIYSVIKPGNWSLQNNRRWQITLQLASALKKNCRHFPFTRATLLHQLV